MLGQFALLDAIIHNLQGIVKISLETSGLWKRAHIILGFCESSFGNSEPKKQLSGNINNRMN